MTLGQYGVQDGYCIHCVDPDYKSKLGEFDDVSKVEKFTISDEEYNKRDDTFRKFRERQLKINPNFKSYVGEVDADHQKESALKIEVGSRCECKVGGMRGEVKYVGKVAGLEKGYWVGVKLDEPVGDNDGKSKGKTYFDCGNKFGKFVRPDDLNIGDYPEIDEFDMEDDMI